MTTIRYTLTVLLLASASLFQGGCCMFLPAFPCGTRSGSGMELDFLVRSLDDRRIPLVLADDGNARDVKSKDRKKYRPAAGGDRALKKRFKMVAKQDGASATECLDRRFEGDSTLWVRVAVDRTRGLEDGVSCAFLERQAEGILPVVRVEAVWNEAIDGLTAVARIGGVPVGFPMDYAGQRELFLMIRSIGNEVSLQAAAVAGDAHDGYSTPDGLFHTVMAEDEAYRIALGVCGLGKKGTFYFNHLTSRIHTPPAAGAENEIATEVVKALVNVRTVERMIGYPGPHDFQYLIQLIASAHAWLEYGARSQFEQAVLDGTLDRSTNVKAVRKSIDRATRALMRVESKLATLQASGRDEASGVGRRLKQADDLVFVLLGQLFGYQDDSARKLRRTLELAY